MVRVIVLALFLTACASNEIKYGKEVAAILMGGSNGA